MAKYQKFKKYQKCVGERMSDVEWKEFEKRILLRMEKERRDGKSTLVISAFFRVLEVVREELQATVKISRTKLRQHSIKKPILTQVVITSLNPVRQDGSCCYCGCLICCCRE